MVKKQRRRRGNYGYHKKASQADIPEVYCCKQIRLQPDTDKDSNCAVRAQRSGNDGIRNPCWGLGGHRDSGHHCFSAEDSGAVGCDLRRNQQPVGPSYAMGLRSVFGLSWSAGLSRIYECLLRNAVRSAPRNALPHAMRSSVWSAARNALRADGFGRKGQGTVEYAVVLSGVIAVFLACGALWRAFESGLFVERAASNASHHIGSGLVGAIADVLLF